MSTTALTKFNVDETRELTALARFLAPGSLIPQSIRNKPEDVALVLMAGHELGMGPTTALRSLYVVHGRLSWSAEAAVGRAREAGAIKSWDIDSSPSACTIKATNSHGDSVSIRWSMEDAQRAGLVKRDSNWTKFPEDMLYARCAIRVIRRLCPEVLNSMPAREELEDAATAHEGSQWEAPPAPKQAEGPEIDTAEEVPFEPVEEPAQPQDTEAAILAAIDAASDLVELERLVPRIRAHGKTPTIGSAYRHRRGALVPSSKPEPPDEPEPNDAPNPDDFKIPGGKSKGTPLPDASDRDLDYWRGKKEETIADPNANPKWVDEARAWLAACDEEQRRRSAGEQAEFFGDADEERF